MEQLTIPYPTDTAHPQPSIPIYFIHSIKQPFCNNPSCWCKTNKARIAPLLKAVQTGEMLLSQAASFANGKTE